MTAIPATSRQESKKRRKCSNNLKFVVSGSLLLVRLCYSLSIVSWSIVSIIYYTKYRELQSFAVC